MIAIAVQIRVCCPAPNLSTIYSVRRLVKRPLIGDAINIRYGIPSHSLSLSISIPSLYDLAYAIYPVIGLLSISISSDHLELELHRMGWWQHGSTAEGGRGSAHIYIRYEREEKTETAAMFQLHFEFSRRTVRAKCVQSKEDFNTTPNMSNSEAVLKNTRL